MSSPRNHASKSNTPAPDVPDRVLCSRTKPSSLLADVITERDEISPLIHPQQSFDSINAFIAYNTLHDFIKSESTTSFLETTDLYVLSAFEQNSEFLFHHAHTATSHFPFRFCLKDYNPDKAPDSYEEAIARPDQDVWKTAMQRKKDSLEHRGAFERITPIPKGRKPIGVRWTYTHKYHPDGSIRRGEEKAQLVSQGFSQRAGVDFGYTYAPVVKFTSIRIILAFANFHDLEIMSFDVKTAFLHAKLDHTIFVKQIPGFPKDDPRTVLRLLVALYGLRQSTFEFYNFLFKLLTHLGLTRCEVDHSVFIRRWTSPPHPSISMPTNGDSLLLIVPVHVDDGLAVCNSIQLYRWFIAQLLPDLEIVDMGPVTMYLGNHITRDHAKRKLWISQKPLIVKLLENLDMLNCTPNKVSLSQPLHKLPDAPPNSIPNIAEDDITTNYQRIVGSLTYLAICMCPDIAYAAMALGQFNASPTRAHLLAAKGVLRYLAGTLDYGIEYSATPSTLIPASVAPYVQGQYFTVPHRF